MFSIIRCACLLNKKTSSRLLNILGFRNFNISRSALLTGSEEKKGMSSPERVAQQDANVDNYVNFLLQMTPLQDEKQPNVFRGNDLYIYKINKNAFGGCLLGQALSAAVCTAPRGQLVNSLHNYFLSAGRHGCVDYHVETVRDGNTFCNRFVHAEQNGKRILNMQVSFKRDEVEPFQHQHTMPDCKKPEEIVPIEKLMEKKLSEDLSEDVKKMLKYRPIIDPVVEFRPVDDEIIYQLKPLPPKSLIWMKIRGKLGDDENLHRCAITILSDYSTMMTTVLPRKNALQKFNLASLNHAMWFHNNARADDWLLYETESCHTGNGVGLCTGRFWTQDGVLAASISQQGIVRSLL